MKVNNILIIRMHCMFIINELIVNKFMVSMYVV